MMINGGISHFRDQPTLKAEGSLSYLDFIRLVEKMWTDAHPHIPLYATGTATDPNYPCILYRLDLRKPMDMEPKLKMREEVRRQVGQDIVLVRGQRFDNLVVFTVMTENDAQAAEEIIETFEDFMLEYIGVFKRLGLSEMVYARRLPDSGQSRQGRDVIERSIAFLVRTEKIIVSTEWKMNQIVADARLWLSTNAATPNLEDAATPDIQITDQFG